MEPTRRSLLLGLTAASIAPACGDGQTESGDPPDRIEPAPDRAEEPGAWAAPGTEDATAFPYGVQAGDALADAVLISVRTEESGCGLVVVAAEGDGWTEVARLDGLDSDGIHVAVEVSGLQPDTAHRYALYAADGTRRTAVGRFRTAPDASTPARKLVLGASSCWGSVNPTFPSLSQAAARQVDAMLLLGDTVYADAADTLETYRLVWNNLFAKEHPRALFASTSVVATWDDHEVDNNWYEGITVSSERVQDGTFAFREAIPQRQGPGGSGLWRVHSLGPAADVFVLDCRGERDGFTRIMSAEQLDAMSEAIRSSTATFKIVLSSVHMTDHTMVFGPVEAEDRWQGYEVQRETLIKACEETTGAFVVTGDMHFSAVQLVGRPGEPGDALVELAAGPAGSSLFPFKPIVDLATEPLAQYVWVGETWTVTVITLDPGTGEVHAEFLDDGGTLVGEHRWIP